MAKKIKKKGSKRQHDTESKIIAQDSIEVEGIGEIELIISEESLSSAGDYIEVLRQQRLIRSIDTSQPMAYQNDRVVKFFREEQDMPLVRAVESASIYYDQALNSANGHALMVSVLDSNFIVERDDRKKIVAMMADHLVDIQITEPEIDHNHQDVLEMHGVFPEFPRNLSNALEQKVSLLEEIIKIGGKDFVERLTDMVIDLSEKISDREDDEEIDDLGFQPDGLDELLDDEVDAVDQERVGSDGDTD